MPRRKLSRVDDDEAAALPELTDQQRHFVERILAGDTASDAYRKAYDCSNTANVTLWANASRLRNDSNVAAWLSAARKAHLGSAVVTLDGHVRELERLREIALDTGNVGAAVQAEQLRGKATGHYVEQYRDLTPPDPAETIRQLAAVAPSMARQLAEAMGLKLIESVQPEPVTIEHVGELASEPVEQG